MTEIRELEDVAELLRVLGHGVRLSLLECLRQGERSVGDIETRTGIVQPALSQQLGTLRKAGLVLTRREAKMIFYRLDTSRLTQARDHIDRLVGQQAPLSTPGRVPANTGASSAAAFARILRPLQTTGWK